MSSLRLTRLACLRPLRLPRPPAAAPPRSIVRWQGAAPGAAAAARVPPAAGGVRFFVLQRRRRRYSSSKSPPSKPEPAGPHRPPTGAAVEAGVKRAAALHEDIYTLPNFLTLTRLAAAPAIGFLVMQDAPAWAVGLFVYAAVTDVLDGWIARRWNLKTVVGTVIDPMADKALMTILTICLAAKGALPVWVATIILGRDVSLGIAAIYYRWISLPPPRTFARYWNFSLPSAEVRPTTISKYNTFLQLILVGLTTAAPLVDADLSLALGTLQYVVAITTIWSGASYVFTKNAVKIIKQSKDL